MYEGAWTRRDSESIGSSSVLAAEVPASLKYAKWQELRRQQAFTMELSLLDFAQLEATGRSISTTPSFLCSHLTLPPVLQYLPSSSQITLRQTYHFKRHASNSRPLHPGPRPPTPLNRSIPPPIKSPSPSKKRSSPSPATTSTLRPPKASKSAAARARPSPSATRRSSPTRTTRSSSLCPTRCSRFISPSTAKVQTESTTSRSPASSS